VPERQKIKISGLDQYGAKAFERQQFGIAGVEGVKWMHVKVNAFCLHFSYLQQI